MPDTGMDADVFDQFIGQLRRYVRERLVPAEREVIDADAISDTILAEMCDMGLFGLTMPEKYGGSAMNISQCIPNFQLIQAMLADSDIEIYAAGRMLDDAARRADAGEPILRKAAAA